LSDVDFINWVIGEIHTKLWFRGIKLKFSPRTLSKNLIQELIFSGKHKNEVSKSANSQDDSISDYICFSNAVIFAF
jgi:hypothetical protein